VWRFAAGMSGIMIGAIALGQVDKLLLSRLVPLESFGYYSVAGLVASGVSFPAMAIYGATFPVFAQLVVTEQWDVLRTSYHRTCQWLSLALFPPSLALALFPREVLEIYVPHSAVASHAAELLRTIAVGHMLSSILVLPLAVQLAYGWTRLALFKHVIGVPLFVGALVLWIPRYGALGAALAWVGVNVGFVACEIPLMHQRLLKGEMSRWYLTDVAAPACAAAVILGLSRWVMPLGLGAFFNLLWLAGSTGLALVALAALLPATRPVFKRLLAR
jgi:O-antigen/teichoic acid export membrane protein